MRLSPVFIGVVLWSVICLNSDGWGVEKKVTNRSGVWAVMDLKCDSFNGDAVIPAAYVQDGQLHNAGGPMMLRFQGTWTLISSDAPLPVQSGRYEWFQPIRNHDRPFHRVISPFQSGGRIRARVSFGADQKIQFAEVDWAPENAAPAVPSPVPSSDMSASGRFNFVVPAPLARTSRQQSIYGTDAQTFPYPPQGIAALWKEQISSIAQAYTVPADFVGSLEKALAPGVGSHGQWYFDSPQYKSILLTILIQRWEDHVLVLWRTLPRGKSETAERLLVDMMHSYRKGAADGFAVGAGALQKSESLSETSRWTLRHPHRQELKLSFVSQSIDENTHQEKHDLSEEKMFAKATGSSLKVISKKKRVVAGLKGEDVRIAITLPKKGTQIRFTWHFEGVPRDSTRPAIDLRAQGTAADQVEMERVWESLLSSIQCRLP